MKKNKSDPDNGVRYIKVPLPMIRLLIKDKKNIRDVISYGVYMTAMAQKLSVENAALQLLYAYRNMNNPNRHVELPSWLTSNLDFLDEKVGGLLCDEDHGGFTANGSSFTPSMENGKKSISVVRDYCNENSFFAEKVVEFHALRQVAELLNLSRMNTDAMQKVHEKYKKYDNEPFAYVNVQIMYDYMNDIDNKSDDDIACLIMYLAYKSIIGKDTICRASKELTLARMVGARGRSELESVLKKDYARKFYERYSAREVFKRIQGMVKKYKFIPRIHTIPDKPGLGTFISCDTKLSDRKYANLIFQYVEDERKRKNKEKVSRFRKKYSLHDATDTYLAQMFTKEESKKNVDDTFEIPEDVPF